MKYFKKAILVALFITTAISFPLLSSVEAQANGLVLSDLCRKLPQKGGTRCIQVIVSPVNANIGLPIVAREAKVPKCLWVNYESVRKHPKYQFEGKPVGWRERVAEKDLVARCPNTSFSETADYVSKMIIVRVKAQRK